MSILPASSRKIAKAGIAPTAANSLLPVLLLVLIAFTHATADPASAPESGNSTTPAQPPSETPATQPGKTPAEGGDNTDNQPFVPSESISADSAVAFPVDI